MFKYIFLLLVLSFSSLNAQRNEVADSLQIDTKYREDQFYISITYNLMAYKPEGMTQQGLSGGVHLGVIRDMPINSTRTIAIGLGFGYSHNSYNHNLLIEENNGQSSYSLLSTSLNQYSKNKLNTHELVLPLQFRWRTSTPESHKFWRIYAGFKFNYVFSSIVRHDGNDSAFKLRNTKDLNRFQPYADLAFGWNTWNFYICYALSDMFTNDAQLNNEALAFRTLQFGIVFYLF